MKGGIDIDTIKRRRKPASLMARMPKITPRHLFVWEVKEGGSKLLSCFYTTGQEWPSFSDMKINTNLQIHELAGLQENGYDIVHVEYRPISATRAAFFRLYHLDKGRWDRYLYSPPEYASEGFDFEYFAMMDSEAKTAVEVNPLFNTNSEIAMSLAHGFLNWLETDRPLSGKEG